MKKMNRLPHEQVAGDHDGLPVDGESFVRNVTGEDDVEGHLGHTKGERFLPGMPGTGGDQVRGKVTGEDGLRQVTEDDVEGHSFGHTKGERFLPGMPGTGGDKSSEDVKGS